MDLFDLSTGEGNPFLDMARAAQPQMMPNSPAPGAGFMYGRDQARQDQMLQQAQGLAGLKEQIMRQKMQEYMSGAPGRKNMIDAANAESEGVLGAAPQKAKNMVGAEQVKAMKQQIEKLAPYLNSWDGAEDAESKDVIANLMREDGASFGKVKLGELPPDKLDKVMKSLRQAQINDQKFEIEGNKNTTKEKVAKTNADAAMDRTKRTNEFRVKLKQLDLESKEKFENEYNRLSRALSEGKITEQQYETLKFLSEVKMFATQGRQDAIKPQLTVKGGKIESVPPAKTPVPVPPRAGVSSSGGKAMSLDDYLKMQEGK